MPGRFWIRPSLSIGCLGIGWAALAGIEAKGSINKRVATTILVK